VPRGYAYVLGGKEHIVGASCLRYYAYRKMTAGAGQTLCMHSPDGSTFLREWRHGRHLE